LVGSAAEEDERREQVEESIQPRVTVTVREVGPRYGFALTGATYRMRVGHGLERLVENDGRRILEIRHLACC